MATYRPVDIRVWSDRKFLSLSEDGRMLWLFLLTTTFTRSIPGVIVAGEAALSEELGWNVERFRKGFGELFDRGLSVRRDGRLVWLKNALKYQPIAGPNSIKGMSKIWDDVPNCAVKHEVWQALKVACKSWDRLFAKGFPEPLEEPSPKGFIQDQEQDQEQKQEQDQEQKDPRSPSAHVISLAPAILKAKTEKTAKAPPGYQDVIAEFNARYLAAYGSAPTWRARQGRQVKDLLATHSLDEIQRRIGILFSAPPAWLKGPHDFGTLVQHFDKLVTANLTPLEQQLERVRMLEAQEAEQKVLP